MTNLLHLQLSSSSHLLAGFRRRYCYSLNCEIDILNRDSFECRASPGERFKFRAEEEELFRDGGFGGFEFGKRKKKKKKPWWLDDDEDDDEFDDWMNDEQDWSMVFVVFRTLSWMLAPIGISLLLGTDSNAGLMALAVPLVQSLLSLMVDKVLSRPSIGAVNRSRRDTFWNGNSGRRRRARREEDMGGGSVDKGGYKSWMVGDDDSTSSRYGGWDDLDKRNTIRYDNPSKENVRSSQQFERKARRRWRVKEKPLLLRMLLAAFPFLSSWTKLLF